MIGPIRPGARLLARTISSTRPSLLARCLAQMGTVLTRVRAEARYTRLCPRSASSSPKHGWAVAAVCVPAATEAGGASDCRSIVF